jgi:hypothetical protein
MRLKFKIKPLLITLSLSCISANTWALLSSDKLIVDSVNGDNIIATVSYLDNPVEGDLYLATEYGGELYFFGPDGGLSATMMPFQENGSFSEPIEVLNKPSAGIYPGVYPLYQVVTLPGADPRQPDNWIGGLNQLEFRINLNNDSGINATDSETSTDTGETATPEAETEPEVIIGPGLTVTQTQ